MKKPLIGITLGDPCGIGPEVVAKVLNHTEITEWARLLVIGDAKILSTSLKSINSEKRVVTTEQPEQAHGGSESITVLEVPNINVEPPVLGKHSKNAGLASHAWVETAGNLALEKKVDAIVTAPINKTSWKLAEIKETGHQEVFQRLSGSKQVYTMLVSGQLRCMHLTTHLPLVEACNSVTKEKIGEAISITNDYLQRWGFAQPKIAVAALNPHGGDSGLIGREEIEEIAPAIEKAQSNKILVTGPIPADSVFVQAIAGKYDVVIVLYHDQGHIAIKVHGFEQSISINLGLPFIRTSVDHGTAFDIAGKGIADETSLIEAIRTAVELATGTGINTRNT
jgi:4-hydroxythreonine-4-phosphate dehydrogenase